MMAPAMARAAVGRIREGMRVHLVGIGGAGMSGLARALHQRGVKVSGSDRDESAVLESLRALGIAVTVGHSAGALPTDVDLLVRTPAVPDDNVELVTGRERGLPIIRRAAMLALLVSERSVAAVAGTHGKTTTTAMLAHILDRAGLEPTYFVGGDVPSLGANAAWGSGEWAVVEADEYDRAFLLLEPTVAVITNIEHDHPDHYPTFDSVVEAFARFAELTTPEGLVLAWAGPAAAQVAARSAAEVEWYAVEGDAADPDDLDWTATDIIQTENAQSFEVTHRGDSLGRWQIRLPGRHNVANALAAIGAASRIGVEREAAREALASFPGAERRFQIAGSRAGVTIIDDYAHHPTEIRATLAAARERYPDRAVWAVVQPHTFSRLALLADDYAAAAAGADRAIVTPVFAAREAPRPGISHEMVAGRIPGGSVAASPDAAGLRVAEEAPRGTVVLFLGAGDIQRGSRAALMHLSERAIEELVEAADTAGLGGTRLPNMPLAQITSLRVGGSIDLAVRVSDIGDLEAWWLLARRLGVPVRVIGRGSNLLASDEGYRGVVLLNRCEVWRLEGGDAAGRVVADSGVTLAALGHSLARQGWSGLEAAVGIPGSLGAAVVTNAGAHGWSMSDSVLSARVVDDDGNAAEWPAEELDFQYRGSALKGREDRLVTHVTVAVRRDDPTAAQARIAEFTSHRKRTQPAVPSVGSMFKNPPGDYAGRLIEAAGLKGERRGGAQISDVHANFFVNAGAATSADVMALIELARREVKRQFGIVLELEIEALGGGHAR